MSAPWLQQVEVVSVWPLEPVAAGLSSTDVEVHDIGLAYRRGDERETLDLVEGIVDNLGRLRLTSGAEGVLATAYLREDLPGFVLHFVNERYRPFADTVEGASDIGVRVDRPASFDDSWDLWVLAPGRDPVADPFHDAGTVSFTLPRLDVYAAAVFASELPPS